MWSEVDNKFYDFAKANNDLGLQHEAELLRIYNNWGSKAITLDKAAVLGRELAKKAALQDNWISEIRAYRYVAYILERSRIPKNAKYL